MEREVGMYIHIPFCKRKCAYCDFISFAGKEEIKEEYVEAIVEEIKEKAQKYKEVVLDTLYMGGGTPSILEEKQIKKILQTIKENFIWKSNIEITIEINPGTVSKDKLEKYQAFGINRLSIGLQSADNSVLKEIGRIHTYEEFLETYQIARNIGFSNINVDVMLALPTQSLQSLQDTIEKVIALNPEHISVYSLIIEEGTPIAERYKKGKIELPTDEEERNMYDTVKKSLENSGYKHYEISNFAKIGKESKHNLHCWEQREYIGIGVAAHSYIEQKRFSNIENLELYIRNCKQKNIKRNEILQEVQNKEEQSKEYMLLGLRKIEGVQISKYKEKFGENPIYKFRNILQKLVEEELIEIDLDTIRLTKRGIDVANIVWEEFV